jgi:LacI family transcriptional regulator
VRLRRPVTLVQVAALAGVAPSTASKALSGRGQLRPETRQRVRAAAEELGFQPNALARGLIEGRTYTVGIITTDSFGRFSVPVMLGAEDALGRGQMSVLMCDGRGDSIREQHHLRTLLGRRVDGIIVTGRRREPRAPIGADLPVPVAYVGAPSEDPSDFSVVPDEEQGATIAIRHLLTTGRTSVAHITGPQRHLAARLREAGARRALEEAGSTFAGAGPLWGEWSESWGRDATHIVLRSSPDIEAIFCGSDQIARGVADALREAGRSVPRDVAIVGFDNWEVMALASRPPLTTVDRNLTDLGHQAAITLLEAVDGRPAHGLVQVSCELIIRESTALQPSDK